MSEEIKPIIEYEIEDIDFDKALDRGKSLRGEPIFKIRKGASVKVEVLEKKIIKRPIDTFDKDNKGWVEAEINRYKELDPDLYGEMDYVPYAQLTIKTLEDVEDPDGGIIKANSEVLFGRPERNAFWDSFRTVTGRKKIPYEIRIMRLADKMGRYIAAPVG